MTIIKNEPLVSICTICYNHEKYIPFFMESILAQTYTNWELIVTDDCSTDGSFELLKSYNDDRIKIYQNDKNRHLCETFNHSASKAKGDYICIISTDDAFVKTKLETDVKHMQENTDVGALYTDLSRIDENNNPIKFPAWNLPSKDGNILLNQLFYKGNVLSIPGLFLKKEALEKVGGHHPFLCLTQDYEFHIRLLFDYEPDISKEATVLYRMRDNEMNLSALNYDSHNLIFGEYFLALKIYVEKIKTVKKLLEIFPEATKYGEPKEDLIPYFIGRLAIDSNIKHVQYFGFNLLYDFLTPQRLKEVEGLYGFLGKDFMNLLKSAPLFYNKRPKKRPIKDFIKKLTGKKR